MAGVVSEKVATPGGVASSSPAIHTVDLTKRWDKEGNLEKAIALLTDVTKQDPNFALGFARLANWRLE